MNYTKHVLFAAAILLFSVNGAFAQKSKFVPVSDYKKKEAAVARLEKDLPALMKAADIPGVSIALVRNGKPVWTRGFGVVNSETKEAVREETVFEAASLTKPVFAYAVLKLVDAGKLDLDAPLNKYLPGSYDVAPDDARIDQVTARRVLSHTTGFPNWRAPRNSKTLPVYFTPGERFSYSGEGFVYLSKAVEKITGMKFDEYVRQSVFAPLGMTNSALAFEERHKKTKTFNHDLLGNPAGQGEGATPNAAGSLLTTSGDYAKFVAAVLDGTGLKKETRRLMTTAQIRVDEACLVCTERAPEKLSSEIGWGLGWGLQMTDEGKSFWHWGDNGNNKAFIVAFEKQKDGIVLLTNGANGLSILKEILADGLGGKQPALAWLNAGRYDSPARVLLKAIVNEGPEKALADYRKRRAASAAEKLNEARVNSLGYDLLRARKTAEAIAVFRLNAEDFPASANVWDSLAEAYMINGDIEKAIENYKKSLALNPNNKGAAERIKQLEQ
ncbi:MAG TPA: serine hydrolase [Pyrinomonadaceae bacterium]|jgi:CubicO group peptidase (beta-lactamase class C family)